MQRARVGRHIEVSGHPLESIGRVAAEGLDPAGGAVPIADVAGVDPQRADEVSGQQLGDLARIEAARQFGAHVEQATQLAGQVQCSRQQPRRSDRDGGLIGQDREDLQVVLGERIESELGQTDDADDLPVVADRHDEHRFVDVVGARDRPAAGIAAGLADQQRLTVDGDPAGEAFSVTTGQTREIDRVVRAASAGRDDGGQTVPRFTQVEPRVVVLDDPAELLEHGSADIFRGMCEGHPGRGRLHDLELGGQRRDPVGQGGIPGPRQTLVWKRLHQWIVASRGQFGTPPSVRGGYPQGPMPIERFARPAVPLIR